MQTTNDNIPIERAMQRRSAFAAIFQEWPHVLAGFTRSAGLGYHGEKTADADQRAAELLGSPDFGARGLRCLAAQFAVQLLVTRAHLEGQARGNPRPLNDWLEPAFLRLDTLHTVTLQGFSMQASARAEKALRSYNGELASLIFASLDTDAQRPDFDEGDFWADVFRGIGDGARGIVVPQALSLVVLDHLDALRHVFRAMNGGHALDLHTTHH